MARRSLLVATLVAAALCACATASVLDGVDLTNFQQEYACDNTTTLIVRPRNVGDVQNAVKLHDAIMAAGAGHSWDAYFFCASPQPGAGAAPSLLVNELASRGAREVKPAPRPSSAVNIALTTIRPCTIDVNETGEYAWVDAGVITADLLDYLANYVTAEAPAGWTLPAFPWFVYQTIGGAVATGSHGSSLKWGSLSSARQLLGLQVVTADGELQTFTPEENPFLFKALRVSVGKLGVIVRVKLRILREVPVRRELYRMPPPAFLGMMRELQSAARDVEAGTPGAALPKWLDETEWFWVPQKYEFMRVSYARADDPNATVADAAHEGFRPDATSLFVSKGALLKLGEITLPADAVLNLTAAQLVDPGSLLGGKVAPEAEKVLGGLAARINEAVPPRGNTADPAIGDAWNVPTHNRPSAFYAAVNMADGTNEASRIGILEIAGNATVESTAAYIKQPATTLPQLRRILYDQYEASFPLTVAGDCFEAVLQTAYGDDLLGADPAKRATDKGFRTAPLIRFVGQEDGLLSHTHDGPRAFLNIEDYLFYNQGRRPNTRFRAIVATLTSDPRCTAKGPVRFHWGKAGWPDPGCWRGDETYGDNWCSFGCAVRALDPAGKFRDSAPDRWTWAGVDLERCCGDAGFDATKEGCACRVTHARAKDQCPPPPFYTSR